MASAPVTASRLLASHSVEPLSGAAGGTAVVWDGGGSPGPAVAGTTVMVPLRLALGVTDGVSLELPLEEPVSDGDVVMEALPGADSDTLPEAVPEAVSDGDGEAVSEAEIVCDPVGLLVVAAVMGMAEVATGVRVAVGVRVVAPGVRVAVFAGVSVAELDARVRVAVGLCAAVSDASSAALSSTTARNRIPLNGAASFTPRRP